MQLPADGRLQTHSSETLIYSTVLLGTAALISCFPSGIQATKEGEECGGRRKMKHNAIPSCNESQVQTPSKVIEPNMV